MPATSAQSLLVQSVARLALDQEVEVRILGGELGRSGIGAPRALEKRHGATRWGFDSLTFRKPDADAPTTRGRVG